MYLCMCVYLYIYIYTYLHTYIHTEHSHIIDGNYDDGSHLASLSITKVLVKSLVLCSSVPTVMTHIISSNIGIAH